MPQTKTILFLLSGSLGIKNVLYSPFFEQEFSRHNIRVVFALENAALHAEQLKPGRNIIFEESSPDSKTTEWEIKSRFVKFLYETLNYRFSKINNLKHFDIKENIPKEYITSGEDIIKPWARLPFPSSSILFHLLASIYNFPNLRSERARHLMERYSPQVVLLTNAQIPQARDYCVEAKKKKAKVIAYINNWDNLTVRGPVLFQIDEFAVWGKQMEEDLRKIHRTDKPIHRVGPLHLDYSFASSYVWDKKRLCRHIGISPDKNIFLLGAYGERFGAHEPSIAKHIAENLLTTHNGHLVVRSYPRDNSFFKRYQSVKGYANVTLMKGHDFSNPQTHGVDDRVILNSLVQNSSVVISSGCSIDLEALRFRRPVIDIGFDGDLALPKAASIASRFNMLHHDQFFRYNSTYFVKNYSELDEAIAQSLTHPEALAENIRKMKYQYLEPLDGKASERLFELIKNHI